MSIGAGGILGASLMLGLALGTTASAQTPSNGTWTDPPARSAAPAPPTPAAESPVTSVKERGSAATSGSKAAEGAVLASKPESSAPSAARSAAVTTRRTVREAKHMRVAVEAPHARSATPRLAVHREAVRTESRRVVAHHAFAPRMIAAQPYPYRPLPVGRVAGPIDGERNPIFADGDDRMRRIAAAQAAGYLVLRARSVQYPDGRTMRSYRPYDDDDGLD